MNIREEAENLELSILSKYATLSINSKGREREETPCDIRPVFQRDRDRIIHSKSFRRLKDKTQVFLAPIGDHYRNRLTHTLEVTQISRTIARALKLNEILTEAIALGHDLGHTPFGHCGERVLNKLSSKGFVHSEQSVRIVKYLENKHKGLNLSYEVIDGIRNHQTSGNPSTMEGKIVQICDKIAYINHDIDDAIRGGVLKNDDIPKEFTDILGDTVKLRLDTMIHDLIINSRDKDDIIMSEEIEGAVKGLRKFMFNRVYLNERAKKEEPKAELMLETLYNHYKKNKDMIPQSFIEDYDNNEDLDVIICDYIAGMTDQYAIREFEKLYIPLSWSVII